MKWNEMNETRTVRRTAFDLGEEGNESLNKKHNATEWRTRWDSHI